MHYSDKPGVKIFERKKLHPREQQIADLVSKGNSNKEIAAICGLTEQSIKARIHSIFRVIGVSNRTELAIYWMKRIMEN